MTEKLVCAIDQVNDHPPLCRQGDFRHKTSCRARAFTQERLTIKPEPSKFEHVVTSKEAR
jgi:hypothetical protein